MGIFKNFFSHKEINASVLCLQGIYFKSDKVYGNAAWDQLRDENTSESLTVSFLYLCVMTYRMETLSVFTVHLTEECRIMVLSNSCLTSVV